MGEPYISFPELGLNFNIQNYFMVFGFKIYWYGVIIAAAILLALLLALRASRKYSVDPDDVINLALFALPVSVVLARAYYVVFNHSEFKNLIDIINIRRGGLAIYGGVIGAILTTYFYTRYKKINLLAFLDFGVPYLVLGQAIGRWGNYVNQEAYGTATNLPWGMTGSSIGDVPVHPTFLYESLWNICLFIFLIWFRKRKKLNGEVFFLYMAIYGLGRFWIEGLRIDSLMLGGFRVSQVLALLFAIGFFIAFLVNRMKAAEKGLLKAPEEEAQEEEVPESRYSALLKKMQQEENEPAEENNQQNSQQSNLEHGEADKTEDESSDNGNNDGK